MRLYCCAQKASSGTKRRCEDGEAQAAESGLILCGRQTPIVEEEDRRADSHERSAMAAKAGRNHYDTLGVKRDATGPQIKKA